jgi:hypothetical protein
MMLIPPSPPRSSPVAPVPSKAQFRSTIRIRLFFCSRGRFVANLERGFGLLLVPEVRGENQPGPQLLWIDAQRLIQFGVFDQARPLEALNGCQTIMRRRGVPLEPQDPFQFLLRLADLAGSQVELTLFEECRRVSGVTFEGRRQPGLGTGGLIAIAVGAHQDAAQIAVAAGRP